MANLASKVDCWKLRKQLIVSNPGKIKDEKEILEKGQEKTRRELRKVKDEKVNIRDGSIEGKTGTVLTLGDSPAA